MKTCKACKQEIPLALGYRDMEPIEVAPKKIRFSSLLFKFWFSVKNPIMKAMLYPVGFVLAASTIAGGLFLAFPGIHFLGVFVASLFGTHMTLEHHGPIPWLIGIVPVVFLISSYYLGKYFAERIDRWRLLNER